jgi:hypothetical protein
MLSCWSGGPFVLKYNCTVLWIWNISPGSGHNGIRNLLLRTGCGSVRPVNYGSGQIRIGILPGHFGTHWKKTCRQKGEIVNHERSVGSSILGWHLDPGFWFGQKFIFFDKNIAIYLSLGLHKGRPSHRRSLQLSKENFQNFKTWNFLNFFYFCGSPPPQLNPELIWIRIRNSAVNKSIDVARCTGTGTLYQGYWTLAMLFYQNNSMFVVCIKFVRSNDQWKHTEVPFGALYQRYGNSRYVILPK